MFPSLALSVSISVYNSLLSSHQSAYCKHQNIIKNNWAQWIPAPLTYLQSSHNHPTSYLHNLISVQPPRSTSSSSLVTLACPSTSSSLRITCRSFQYASRRLWNQLPASLRQPRTNLSNSASPSSMSGTYSTSSIDSPLSSSITPSLFHSRLKTYLFCKSFPCTAAFPFLLQDWLHGFPRLFTVYPVLRFSFSVFTLFSCLFCAVD